MKKLLAICILAVGVAPAHAQSPDQRLSRQLDAKGHEKLVDGITTALVGISLLHGVISQIDGPCSRTGNLIENGYCDPKGHVGKRLLKDAVAIGLTVVISETVKRLVHRTRPDGSDDKSFFSEHTALASLPIGWLPGAKIPIVFTFSVGVGRVASRAHYPSDVLAGAAIGQLVGAITR